MLEPLSQPWPWYIAGPLIGLTVPALLLMGNKSFGISANLRHLCSAVVPAKPPFLRYDWWAAGSWNLAFALGIVAGGWLALRWFGPSSVPLAAETTAAIRDLGLRAPEGLVPTELFGGEALRSPLRVVLLLGGGFLVGFGARYAGGCTSGHAISGLASRQLPSLLAVVGFFIGGLIAAHLLLPRVLHWVLP